MVVVDFDGHVMRYDQLNVMEYIVAAPACTLELDVPGPGGRGWKRTAASIDTANDPELGETLRNDLSTRVRHLREQA